ncbi:hypothetical protein LAV_00127 [Sphingobium phage Lacusarx]|uniref:Uncharacterized protein n=1 Tax=Sphingobium phage Lacusarx TaxID=1980139 RepID=A0A1W6DXK8_9CAUD|nr:hypothetical protein FDH44_gp176 [Sphingobium phage Lacusarx]ARK07502.1 hypothetical protein LAV_00127 [Sphingobium phage Lacusarx]
MNQTECSGLTPDEKRIASPSISHVKNLCAEIDLGPSRPSAGPDGIDPSIHDRFVRWLRDNGYVRRTKPDVKAAMYRVAYDIKPKELDPELVEAAVTELSRRATPTGRFRSPDRDYVRHRLIGDHWLKQQAAANRVVDTDYASIEARILAHSDFDLDLEMKKSEIHNWQMRGMEIELDTTLPPEKKIVQVGPAYERAMIAVHADAMKARAKLQEIMR